MKLIDSIVPIGNNYYRQWLPRSGCGGKPGHGAVCHGWRPL